MKIAVFGTGEVGTSVATKLHALGHEVAFGSRHPGEAKHGIEVLDHQTAAKHGELLNNAMHGENALDVFPRLAVAGKVLWDIGNFQAAIDGPITETLGESLQRQLPDTQVIKGMNFVSAQVMGNPERLDGDHTVFVAGNDVDAKAIVSGILRSFGWADIFDLGDLTACRAMESLAPMWIQLHERLDHVYFDLKVVR